MLHATRSKESCYTFAKDQIVGRMTGFDGDHFSMLKTEKDTPEFSVSNVGGVNSVKSFKIEDAQRQRSNHLEIAEPKL